MEAGVGIKMSDDMAQWLIDNPGKDLEATLKFDRKAIDTMDIEKFKPDIVEIEAKGLLTVMRNAIRKYRERDTTWE